MTDGLHISRDGKEVIPRMSSFALRSLYTAHQSGTNKLSTKVLDGRAVRLLLDRQLIVPSPTPPGQVQDVKAYYEINTAGIQAVEGAHPQYVLTPDERILTALPKDVLTPDDQPEAPKLLVNVQVDGIGPIQVGTAVRDEASVDTCADAPDCANCVYKRVVELVAQKYPKVAELVQHQLTMDALLGDLGLKGN